MIRLYCFLFLLLFSFLNVHSQNQFSPASKRFLFDVSPYIYLESPQIKHLPNELVEEYSLYKNGNEYFVGVLLLVDKNKFEVSQLKQFKVENYRVAGDLYSIRLPVRFLQELKNMQGIRLIDIGDPVSPDLNLSRQNTRADTLHNGLGGLSRGYTGKGVVIAIIDWGFDYTHPVFWDSTLENYRLVRAWDQNKLSGPAPQGYDFGTEYKSYEELMAAKEDTLYVFGPGSHGTHVGGIAGGAGGGFSLYKGIAPEASMIFISLRRDAPSLIDAFTYVSEYAKSVKMPFVVNMSFGSHLGPHDGTDLKNIGLDAIAGPGKIFVGSGGNNGDGNFHLRHKFPEEGDTLKSIVQFNAVDEYYGQTLSMWGSANSSFGVRLNLVQGASTIVFQTPFYFSQNEQVLTDTFLFGGTDSLIVRITATKAFETNNKPNIRVEVRNTTSNRVLMEAVSPDADLHIWNNVRLRRRYTNWGVPFLASFPGAKAGNTQYGLGEPGGVGKQVITVASHFSERIAPSGNRVQGNLSQFSSRGPTVDERRKPDISGPGQNVTSSVNSFDPNPGTIVATTEFQGKEFPFATYSGTSMSGPAVAGVIALLLEMNPTLSQVQIKEILQETARLDTNTGVIGDTSHLGWGRGKVDALAAMRLAKTYPVLNSVGKNEVLVFPNPASDFIQIVAPDYTSIEIVDLSGRVVISKNLHSDGTVNEVNVRNLSPGLYVIRFLGGEGKQYFKLIR